jgi:hypothetical protein
MRNLHNDLSAERVRYLFDYDAESGLVTWRVDRKSGDGGRRIHVRAGDRAGTIKSNGYIEIWTSGTSYLAHRLIWLWVTGDWPANEIDHINRIKNDNRWCNLRAASRSDNRVNCPPREKPTGFPCGVRITPNGKFAARISGVHLGTFATPDEAGQVYNIAATDLYGEFYRGLET